MPPSVPVGGAGGSINQCGSGGSRDPNACQELESVCSFEDTCTALNCGELWSVFDENLCRRTSCTSSSTCADGEVCTPAPLVGHFGVTSSSIGGCDYFSTCECACGSTADALPIAHCLGADELPDSECAIGDMDCLEAQGALDVIETMYLHGEYGSDIIERLEACRMKLEERADCGAGGSG